MHLTKIRSLLSAPLSLSALLSVWLYVCLPRSPSAPVVVPAVKRKHEDIKNKCLVTTSATASSSSSSSKKTSTQTKKKSKKAKEEEEEEADTSNHDSKKKEANLQVRSGECTECEEKSDALETPSWRRTALLCPKCIQICQTCKKVNPADLLAPLDGECRKCRDRDVGCKKCGFKSDNCLIPDGEDEALCRVCRQTCQRCSEDAGDDVDIKLDAIGLRTCNDCMKRILQRDFNDRYRPCPGSPSSPINGVDRNNGHSPSSPSYAPTTQNANSEPMDAEDDDFHRRTDTNEAYRIASHRHMMTEQGFADATEISVIKQDDEGQAFRVQDYATWMTIHREPVDDPSNPAESKKARDEWEAQHRAYLKEHGCVFASQRLKASTRLDRFVQIQARIKVKGLEVLPPLDKFYELPQATLDHVDFDPDFILKSDHEQAKDFRELASTFQLVPGVFGFGVPELAQAVYDRIQDEEARKREAEDANLKDAVQKEYVRLMYQENFNTVHIIEEIGQDLTADKVDAIIALWKKDAEDEMPTAGEKEKNHPILQVPQQQPPILPPQLQQQVMKQVLQ